jgi:hypothetical protein
MKFELIKTESDNEGRFKLECLARSSDMVYYAENSLGRPCKVGDEFQLETAWPANQDGLVATTKEDYEKYGERTAFGTFKRVQ